MAIIPKTVHFGDIQLVEILVFFNTPILFQGLSGNHKDLFCLLVSDENHINKWMVIESSTERTKQILAGAIDLYTGFHDPENGEAVLIDVDPIQNLILKESSVSSKDIDDSMLPDRGVIITDGTLAQKDICLDEVKSSSLLKMHFDFAETPAGKAPVRLLGNILINLQSLLDSICQAIHGSPTERGNIPKGIIDLSALTLEAISTGSTIIDLVPTNESTLFGENSSVIEEFIDLVNSTETENQLTEKLLRLKVRVASNYLNYLNSISTQSEPVMVEFFKSGQLEAKRGSVKQEKITKAIEIIQRIEFSDPEIHIINGILVGMNIEKGTFELHQSMGEGTQEISGRIGDNLLSNLRGTQIGYLYKVTLKKVTKVRKFANDQEEIYELTELKLLSDKNQ
jgi:hypothetical protein